MHTKEIFFLFKRRGGGGVVFFTPLSLFFLSVFYSVIEMIVIKSNKARIRSRCS